MSTLLRYAFIACVVLVAVVVTMACGEMFCGECVDACLPRADRTHPGHLLRRLVAALRHATPAVLCSIAGGTPAAASPSGDAAPLLALSKASTLRI